ncbi:MAG: DUF362 domain-containing protein [Coriobacteriia bacterium]|nr:DUF362 domain-containing protein [Coriobacteriia bacterium]
MVNPTPTQEEREIIIRDKAAREGLTVPDEVVRYIATHRTTDNALKSALINLSAYAYRKQTPITLQMAEYVLEGVRTGVNAKHAAEMTQKIPPVSAEPIEFDIVEPIRSASNHASYELPSFLSGRTSPLGDALTDEPEIVLEDVPQYQPVETPEVKDVVVGGALYEEVGLRNVDMDDFEEPIELVDVPEFETVGTVGSVPFVPDVTVGTEPPVPDVTKGTDPTVPVTEPHFEEFIRESVIIDEPVREPLYVDEITDAFVEPSFDEFTDEFIEPSFDEFAQPVPAVDYEPTSYEALFEPATLFDDAEVITAQKPAAEVFFAPMKTDLKRSFVERAGIALQKAGLDEIINEGDLVAIKLHVGEAGNTAFISPIYIREVVDLVRDLGGNPFLTDANTLYSGQRRNAVDHMTCAARHGFTFATVDAPFIVADGLNGNSWTEVEVDGKHCESVRMGSAAVEADAMVVVSHVKGHGVAGFGGAVKNVGMGLGSRAAKQRMHSDVHPEVNAPKCVHCYKCIQKCPVQAISKDPLDGAAFIDREICYGCGECVATCNFGAIAVSLETDPNTMQEKMVEHAAGIVNSKPDKMIYLSILTDITPECDCWSYSDAPIVPDIGLMASRDMIAIDQAAYDMVVEATGNVHSAADNMGSGTDKFTEIHGTDGTHVMAYGEQFGLGTRNYTITEIG